MPKKLKTRKAVAKRFRVTKKGKIIKKVCGQDHFNARETGKTRRHKRGSYVNSNTIKNVIAVAMPN